MEAYSKTIENLKAIETVLEDSSGSDDPTELICRGEELASIMVLSNQVLASAKKHLNVKKADIIKASAEDYPASVLLKLAEAEAQHEEEIYIRAERANKAITHMLDFIRSVLSFRKEEMINSKYQPA